MQISCIYFKIFEHTKNFSSFFFSHIFHLSSGFRKIDEKVAFIMRIRIDVDDFFFSGEREKLLFNIFFKLSYEIAFFFFNISQQIFHHLTNDFFFCE